MCIFACINKGKMAQIDLQNLKMLTGEDPGFMLEILQMVLDQSPAAVSEMKDKLSRADYRGLSASAHKYKSSIQILGSPEFSALVRNIEQNAEAAQEYETLQQLISRLEAVADETLALIRREMDQLQHSSAA